jgi:hypothetical protein
MNRQNNRRTYGLLRFVPIILFCSISPTIAQTTAPIAATPSRSSAAFNIPNAAPFGSGRIYPPQDIPEDPATIAQQASCVIQIDAPSENTIPWPNNGYVAAGYSGGAPVAQFAVALVTSTVVIDEAATSLHFTAEQRQSQIRVHATAIGTQLFRLEVDLLKGDSTFPTDRAQKLISSLTDQLSRAFEQSADARRKAMSSQAAADAKDLVAMHAQLDDVRAKIRADQAQTSTVGNMMYGDPSNTLINARNNQQNAQTELDRNRAHLATIEPPSDSTLVGEWEALVKQDQQSVQELTAQNPSDPKLKEAQDKLVDAQTHLALAKQQTEMSTDNNQVYRRQEATNLKSTIADQESRLKQLNDTIAKLTDPNYQKALDEERGLQSLEQNVLNRLNELQNRITQMPVISDTASAVIFTVLDGKTN